MRTTIPLLILTALASPLSSIAYCEEQASCGYIFNAYPPVYFPASTHWLSAVSAIGDSVELEDGSVWRISRYDGQKALSWRLNDPLTITQNHRWFSSYNYRIINQNTGASLEANLFLGPLQYGEHTLYICAIDRVSGYLLLLDSQGETTQWEISSGDSDPFQDWVVNDAVVIGQNSGWDASCESILINISMNDFVRARQN